MTAPMVELLRNLKKALVTETSIPVFFTWQDEDTPEPFIVLGDHSDNDNYNPKNGKEVVASTLQAHLFYPGNSRVKLEGDLYKIKSLINKTSDRVIGITSDVLKDNSVGREVYHVVINISVLI